MAGDAMRPVLIYGAGGFGREVVSWLRSDIKTDMRPVAFIDDAAMSAECAGLPVGSLLDIAGQYPGASVLVALGGGDSRCSAAERIEAAGLRPETYMHSSVLVGERVEIGPGSLIMPGSVLTCDIRIGAFVVVNCSCNIGHDVEIGKYSTLLGNNSLNGNVKVGEFVTIGSRATIHPGRRVGDRSTVGIGSVVLKSVRDNVTVFGVPAKAL